MVNYSRTLWKNKTDENPHLKQESLLKLVVKPSLGCMYYLKQPRSHKSYSLGITKGDIEDQY